MKNVKYFSKMSFVLLLLLPAFLGVEAGQNDTLKVYYEYETPIDEHGELFYDSLFRDVRQYYEDFMELYEKKYVEEILLKKEAFDNIENEKKISIKITHYCVHNLAYEGWGRNGCDFGSPPLFQYTTKLEFCDTDKKQVYLAHHSKDRQRSLQRQKLFLMGGAEQDLTKKKHLFYGYSKTKDVFPLLKSTIARQYPEWQDLKWLSVGSRKNLNTVRKRNSEDLILLRKWRDDYYYLLDSHSRQVIDIFDKSTLKKQKN